MKKWIVLTLQLVVSLGLLAWIFRDPDFRAEVWDLLSRANPWWLGAALVVAGVGAALGLLRWAIFLEIVGIHLTAWGVLRIGTIGLLFNNFLPGAVGGDAVKVGWLVSKGYSARASLLSGVMNRLSGLGAMVLCSVTFIALRFDWLMQSPSVAAMIHMLLLFLAGVVTFVTLSFVLSARGTVSRLPAKLPGRARLVEFAETYSLFVSAWRSTLLASTISVVTLLCFFYTFYFCSMALDVKVPMLDFLAIMPVVDLLAALPISAGGFGVREGAFVTLLGQLSGVPAAEAVSISFAGAFATLIWSLSGLLVMPWQRREVR